MNRAEQFEDSFGHRGRWRVRRREPTRLRSVEGLDLELVLGLVMSIETAVGEAGSLHQLIHTGGGLDPVTAEFRGGRLDNATARPGGFSLRLLHAMPSTARAVFSRAAFLLPIRRTRV
jgi:hypothetical protein